MAIPNHVPYCVSKGGIDQLTKVMALALAPHGIRVNAIGPGSIMTDILKAVATDKEAKRRILARTPLGRIGEPDEIAAIAVFLASADASYVTGQTIYADGGRLALNYTVPVEDEALDWGSANSWPPSARRHSTASTSRSSPPCSATAASTIQKLARDRGAVAARVASSGCGGSKPPASSPATRRWSSLRGWRGRSTSLPRSSWRSRPIAAASRSGWPRIDEVVECWEVSGNVDYIARFVCADLAAYEELTSALIDDDHLGVARIVSHVALRPVRRFAGYPEKLIGRKLTPTLTNRRFGRADRAPPPNPPSRAVTSAAQVAAAA